MLLLLVGAANPAGPDDCGKVFDEIAAFTHGPDMHAAGRCGFVWFGPAGDGIGPVANVDNIAHGDGLGVWCMVLSPGGLIIGVCHIEGGGKLQPADN